MSDQASIKEKLFQAFIEPTGLNFVERVKLGCQIGKFDSDEKHNYEKIINDNLTYLPDHPLAKVN